jgi:hypothetical protein
VQLSTKKGGDVVRFDRMSGRGDHLVIDRFEHGLFFENNIQGILDLHEAPVIFLLKKLHDRTEQATVLIHNPVQDFDLQFVGQLLGGGKIIDGVKGIIEHGKTDAFASQFRRQPVMAVAIKLQTKRRIGGHAHIAEAKRFVDKVKIVMQAL